LKQECYDSNREEEIEKVMQQTLLDILVQGNDSLETIRITGKGNPEADSDN
jgi:hypothetical protein